MLHRAALRACIASIFLVGACSLLHPRRAPEPLSVGEIVRMSDAHVPPEQIIARMRTSGTVYRLSASQLASLHDRGVPDAVIDRMQRTYLAAVGRNQFLADAGRWSLQPDGYWYGGLAYGWPPKWLGLADSEEEYHQPPP